MSENKERQKKARDNKVLCGNMLMSKCKYPECDCSNLYKMTTTTPTEEQ